MVRQARAFAMIVGLLLAAPMLHAQEGDAPMPDEVLINETFDAGMDNWWVEGSQDVFVDDGRLMVRADPPRGSEKPFVATIWCKTPIRGNTRIEFDAHVISSSTDANNINFFFYMADLAGAPLYDTREDRADAAYAKYHVMNGNIMTFLKEPSAAGDVDEELPPARIRIRHCPGFELLGETFNYHCEAGRTYHLEIVKRDDFIQFWADGRYLLGVRDPEAWDEGLIGLRTFRTILWWDNIKVTAIK